MNELKKMLLDKKTELEGRLGRLDVRAHQSLSPDSKDRALQVRNVDVVDGLADGSRDELILVNRALERIENSTYGKCIVCHEMIPIERLKARPFSEKCVTCAK